MAAKRKTADETPAMAVTSIKGFNADLTCLGFQFEAGKTFEVSGKIKACGNGYLGKVSGKDGSALFLVERHSWDGPVVNVWAGVVGRDGIVADTFYTLLDGKPVEA